MVRICRHCGMLERLHTDAGIIYGAACDDYEEREDEPDVATVVKQIEKEKDDAAR